LKSLFTKLIILLTAIAFTACSNMEVGFEEDSPFYTPPAEKKSEVVSKVPEVKESKEIKQPEKIKEPEVKIVTQVKEEIAKPVKEKKISKEVENETTFSYSREDGE